MQVALTWCIQMVDMAAARKSLTQYAAAWRKRARRGDVLDNFGVEEEYQMVPSIVRDIMCQLAGLDDKDEVDASWKMFICLVAGVLSREDGSELSPTQKVMRFVLFVSSGMPQQAFDLLNRTRRRT